MIVAAYFQTVTSCEEWDTQVPQFFIQQLVRANSEENTDVPP